MNEQIDDQKVVLGNAAVGLLGVLSHCKEIYDILSAKYGPNLGGMSGRLWHQGEHFLTAAERIYAWATSVEAEESEMPYARIEPDFQFLTGNAETLRYFAYGAGENLVQAAAFFFLASDAEGWGKSRLTHLGGLFSGVAVYSEVHDQLLPDNIRLDNFQVFTRQVRNALDLAKRLTPGSAGDSAKASYQMEPLVRRSFVRRMGDADDLPDNEVEAIIAGVIAGKKQDDWSSPVHDGAPSHFNWVLSGPKTALIEAGVFCLVAHDSVLSEFWGGF